MGEPNNQGWKMGLGPPALPGASLPCSASRQGPSLGTAPAPEGQPQLQRDSQGMRSHNEGFGGHLALFWGCCLVPVLPCSAPLGHRPAGAVAGLQDTSSGDKGHLPGVPKGLAPSA